MHNSKPRKIGAQAATCPTVDDPFPAKNPTDDLAPLWREGRKCLSCGDSFSAKSQFNRILQIKPGHAGALYELVLTRDEKYPEMKGSAR